MNFINVQILQSQMLPWFLPAHNMQQTMLLYSTRATLSYLFSLQSTEIITWWSNYDIIAICVWVCACTHTCLRVCVLYRKQHTHMDVRNAGLLAHFCIDLLYYQFYETVTFNAFQSLWEHKKEEQCTYRNTLVKTGPNVWLQVIKRSLQNSAWTLTVDCLKVATF